MSETTLSTLASGVVDHYQSATQQLLGACRARAQADAQRVHARVTTLAHQGRARLINESLNGSLTEIEGRLFGIGESAFGFACDRADELVQRIAEESKRAIGHLSAVGELVDHHVEGTPSSAVSTLALPGAQLTLGVAERVAAGVSALSARIAGEAEVVEAAPAPRRARRSRA